MSDNHFTFFRVLERENGSLQRWANDDFTTLHDAGVPPEWIKLFYEQKITELCQFPLNTNGHEYAAVALNNFLETASRRSNFSNWDIHELQQAQILDGVCAYSTRESTIAHFQGEPIGRFVATFKGSVTKPLNAENDGFLVRVIDSRIGLVHAKDFR